MSFKRLCTVEIKNIHTGLVSIFDQSLRIEFEYKKSINTAEETSKGWVKIYNLSSDTVRQFGGARFSQVTLYTGYEDDPTSYGVLFRADVTNISYKKDKGTVTTLELSNNFTDLVLGQKVSATVPEGTSKKAAINKLLDIIWNGKASTVYINPEVADAKYTYGYSFHGTPKNALDEICRANDLRWSIQNKPSGDVMHIDSRVLNNSIGNSDDTSIVLNSDTGLIGLPYFHTEVVSRSMDESLGEDELQLNPDVKYNPDGSEKTPNSKKKKVVHTNVACKALINSSVNPQSLIRIETDEGTTDGLYRVQDAKFTGDTFGTTWYMDLELRNGNETKTVATTGKTSTADKYTKTGKPPKNASNYDSQMRSIYSSYGFSTAQMAILKGQVQQESNFDPNAVSPAGAKGLTQFMPATASQYGVIFGDSPSAVNSQINGQAHYMSDLLKHYSGNMTNALMAYNWGQGNLDSYLAHGTPPLPTETANYPSAVFSKAANYHF